MQIHSPVTFHLLIGWRVFLFKSTETRKTVVRSPVYTDNHYDCLLDCRMIMDAGACGNRRWSRHAEEEVVREMERSPSDSRQRDYSPFCSIKIPFLFRLHQVPCGPSRPPSNAIKIYKLFPGRKGLKEGLSCAPAGLGGKSACLFVSVWGWFSCWVEHRKVIARRFPALPPPFNHLSQ